MKLLFDENISYRIIKSINDVFSGSIHIDTIEPKPLTDRSIWEYAKIHNFTIVTFDEDFYDLQLLYGCPPKIIWLRCGNTTTANLVTKLNNNENSIRDLNENEELGMLEIY